MMLPIWEASGGRYGYTSGQLDPRLLTDTERMIKDAQEIRAIAPQRSWFKVASQRRRG